MLVARSTSSMGSIVPGIRSAAVIGAGTMGAAIAAHLTNAGVPTLLLDRAAADATDPAARDGIVRAGLERMLRARPPAVMDADRTHELLTLGNTTDHLHRLADVDWIVEAIIEEPAAKRELWASVESVAHGDAIFSSNSSGIPMRVQSEGRSDRFRRRFLGAHFYNPPRYLYLLELIPTTETDAAVLDTVRAFGDQVLGKGIVVANDVPGFIGNRIGIYALLQAARVAEEMGLPPDVVDALTGPVLGRPKSGTLRLADTVGLDVLALISKDLSAATSDDFRLPPTLQRLVAARRLGEKTAAGYYQRRKNADGTSTILTLDAATFEYAERPAASDAVPPAIAKLSTSTERLRALLGLETPAGEFTRRTVYEMLRFAAEKLGVVANTREDIDHALEWGFGWELGPFRLIDALGAEFVAENLVKMGLAVPPALGQMRQPNRPVSNPSAAPDGPASAGELIVLRDLKRRRERFVRQWPGANLLDLGDGALLLEFTSKANALGEDAFAAVAAAREIVPTGFVGLVIGNQGRWFSAGANLSALLADAADGRFEAVSQMISRFQQMTTSLRSAPFPVVCAPFGMTLGGGCEMMLYSDFVQADSELTTGLVELKVGLMPSAGGTTEMLARAMAGCWGEGSGSFGSLRAVFDLITSGQRSGSAPEARKLGYLRVTDGVTMNKRRLLSDAKRALFRLAAAGYQVPAERTIEVCGDRGYRQLMELARERQTAGDWTAYDVSLAEALARILTGGGAGAPAGHVPESRLLELEREVFVELCGRPQTQERIRHMLATGKPLRN